MCAEDQYARIITKVAEGLPTVPVSASHNNGDWLNTDIYEGELYIDSLTGKLYTRSASGIVDLGSIGSVNIFNSNGALPVSGNREFDLSTGKLFIHNGKVFFGTDDPEWLVPGVEAPQTFQVNGPILNGNGGVSIIGGGDGFLWNGTGDSNAFTAIMDDSSTFGLNLKASHNKVFDSDITPDPSNENSSIFTVWSTRKGTLSIPRMTEAERDAIASPADYLEIVNTPRERKEIYKPFWGWHPVGVVTPDWGYEFTDENLNSSSSSFFAAVGTNGGVATAVASPTLSPTSLWGLSTGPNANGEFRHTTFGNYFIGSVGKKYYKSKVCVDALSTITDRYVSLAGYFRTATGLTATNGMFFLYDEAGIFDTATASPNWLCVCRNGGSYTIVNSGVAVTTTASQLQTLEVLDDGTGANVVFKINSATVATISTNIPNSTITFYAGERIIKTIGTTPRILYNDFTHVKEKFNTPR